jgi:hypothetical protein
MIRLSDSVETLTAEIVAAIRTFAGFAETPLLMFLHTHPNHGQIHVYLSPYLDDQSGDLVGEPIDAAINFKDWAAEWRAPEPVIELIDGAVVSPSNQDQFHRVIAEHVARVAKDIQESLEAPLAPKRVIIESESCEFRDEW